MAHFRPVAEKTSDDGCRLVICIDGHAAWFLERPVDREVGGLPLGAFRSQEAARAWAERHFPGGTWQLSAGRSLTPARS